MLSPGCTVGNLKIGKLLGRGAMGEVYSGEQVTLRRPVAIKRIASHLADDPEIIQRFAREAQVVAKVNSPHVVAVYEFGQYTDDQNDKHYLIIMELVEGAYNLKTCIGTEISWQQASSVIMQVAEGLASAAEHDVIHRDIKPDNIMLSKKGIAKLADFGLAKSVDSTAMTMEGTLMGTPNYMPPEACRGDMVDAKGDIYSLGATWYHLISGMPLFTAANTMALLRAHCDEQPKPLREIVSDVPQDVADFIMSCVAKEKDARPADADAIVDFLQNVSGVPQKVPELVRIAHAAKERDSASGSTMATIADSGAMDGTLSEGQSAEAATMSAGMAETLVTGAHENPNAAADTLAASPSATDDATIAQSPQQMTGKTDAAPAKSKAGLLIAVVVVIAAAASLPFVLGGDKDPASNDPTTQTDTTDTDGGTSVQVDVPVDLGKEPSDVTDTDPQDNQQDKPDQQDPADAIDLAPKLKAVNTALAAKQFMQAQTAYDDLAQYSDEHVALQTQIKDGQKMQAALKREAEALAEQKKMWALKEKLSFIDGYPELAESTQVWQQQVDAFDKKLEEQRKRLDQLEQAQQWSAAVAVHKDMQAGAGVIGPQAVKKLQEVAARIEPKLQAQQQLSQQVDTLAEQQKNAKLKNVLPKMDAYPELKDRKSQLTELVLKKEAQLQKDLGAAKIAVAEKRWSRADESLKKLEADKDVLGEELFKQRQETATAIEKGLKNQTAVAQALADVEKKGEFITLSNQLTTAQPFPELAEQVKVYQATIAAADNKAQGHIDAANKALKAKQYLDAQKELDAVSDDPKVVAAARIAAVQQTREAMKKQGAEEVTAAINAAVAGVEAGTKEGLQQSGQVLRAAIPAAKVSGMEAQLNGVMIKLAEIIEKRSQ